MDISEKYRKGKITSYQYVLDLIYRFYEKDRLLKIEFENILTSQIDDISNLKDGVSMAELNKQLFIGFIETNNAN